ncbi:hypothetical protein G6L37_01300 [Agrobacterium rubi]|nr:hypothetical protein [Agrobacterium rubi]NTF24028.1 hypothetical protein [Agrobacterium rubi]
MDQERIGTGNRIEIAVWRGSESDSLIMDTDRGLYFSTDRDYAAGYGDIVRHYVVTLENPVVVSEEEALGSIEIDRNVLVSQGYDGRMILYDDGSLDVVVFDLGCVEEIEAGAAVVP